MTFLHAIGLGRPRFASDGACLSSSDAGVEINTISARRDYAPAASSPVDADQLRRLSLRVGALTQRGPRHGWAPDSSEALDHPKGLFSATLSGACGYEHIDPRLPIPIQTLQYLGSFHDLGAMI
jgi:hypothetical protein